MRVAVAQRARQVSRFAEIPAPVHGLVLNRAVAKPDPASAEYLENWFPTQRGIRVRGGLDRAAFVTDPVVSLFSYAHPTSPAFFAATADSIYDITSLDPINAPTADVTSQTAGYYSTAQIGTVGGEFLYAVNGADKAQLFGGGSWTQIDGASTPSITGVTTSDLSYVWKYRSRLFFVEKDSKTAWYLPVDSVGGAAASVGLSGVFQRGAPLLFGATWSLDSGNGLDDKCVFVSEDGEVAIYQGADPSDANDWRLVGRYDIAKPLGQKCHIQAGGDLLIGTVDGIVPISQAIQKDPAALSLAAISRPISTLWAFEAVRDTSGHVELLKWPERGLCMVSLPDADRMLAVNIQTGGWGIASAWESDCSATFLGKAYIGRSDGRIMAIDETGMDDTEPFTAKYCHSFFALGGEATYKRAQMVRCAFFAPGDFTYLASISADYTVEFPTAPGAADVDLSGDYMTWDVSNWDEALWWSPAVEEQSLGVTSEWRSVTGAGYALAPCIQVTSGSTQKLNVELVRVDMAYEVGGAVV